MADDGDPRRQRVTDVLQELGPANVEGSAVCTGWVMVVEWMDEKGDRWLQRGWAPSKASWEADGMLHEALYGDWETDDG